MDILDERIRNEVSFVTGGIIDIVRFENALCNKVYFINAVNGKYVIKVAAGSSRKRELKKENDVLRFLEGKIAVPAIRLYNEFDCVSYILMEFIEGETFQSLLSDNNTCKTLRIRGLGQTLREIHEVSLDESHDYHEILNFLLQKAEANMNNDLLDPEEFIIDGKYMEPRRLLDELVSHKTAAANICLLHGDYRPKNVICNSKKNVVIDWGFSETGDPYYDLAVILYYFNKEEQAVFLEGYGIQRLDHEKLRYFDYLSKFINV